MSVSKTCLLISSFNIHLCLYSHYFYLGINTSAQSSSYLCSFDLRDFLPLSNHALWKLHPSNLGWWKWKEKKNFSHTKKMYNFFFFFTNSEHFPSPPITNAKEIAIPARKLIQTGFAMYGKKIAKAISSAMFKCIKIIE